MTAGHPVDEREWTRTIHALLTILVAKLGPERHVHDVPVAGLDDIEEVEVRMLELDDERRRVGGLRTCDGNPDRAEGRPVLRVCDAVVDGDRKSTRLNSSHGYISYAVFCLKKKK